MKVIDIDVKDIKPYENNPRNNDNAVSAVMKSIQEFGFQQPLVLDENNVIIVGHTRFKASQKLGLEKVPCVIANNLTEEQCKAYRLADNKVGELAGWDYAILQDELEGLEFNMADFGFDMGEVEIDWADVEELSEETYEKPEKDMLECPHCHHIDTKVHFKKISSEEIVTKETQESDE